MKDSQVITVHEVCLSTMIRCFVLFNRCGRLSISGEMVLLYFVLRHYSPRGKKSMISNLSRSETGVRFNWLCRGSNFFFSFNLKKYIYFLFPFNLILKRIETGHCVFKKNFLNSYIKT